MALAGFDESYYLSAKLTALQASYTEWQGKDTAFLKTVLEGFGLTPEQHYQQYGYAEGLAPNAYFNADQYTLAKATQMFNAGGYISVASAKEAFLAAWTGNVYDHYLQYGASEAINPSNSFDESSYLDAKLAALQADATTSADWTGKTAADLRTYLAGVGMTPLDHFLTYGSGEGLSAPAVPSGEQVDTSTSTSNPGETFTLTTGADNKVGGTGADTFDASLSATSMTFGPLDSIDGGAGADSLNIAINGTGSYSAASLTNVETIFADFSASGTLNLTNSSGIETVKVAAGSAGFDPTVSGLTASMGLQVLNTSGDVTFNYRTTALAGTADTVSLTVSGMNQAATDEINFGTGIETLAVTSSGGSTNVVGGLDGTGTETITKITIAGDTGLTVINALDATVATVDASAATGAVSVKLGNASASVTGGAGNDTIDYTGGGAADGNVSVDGGAGNDTFVFSDATNDLTTSDTVTGGDGTDTIKLDTLDVAGVTAALSKVTGIEQVEVSDALSDALNATYFGSGVNSIVLNGHATEAGNAITANSGTTTVKLKATMNNTSAIAITASGAEQSDVLNLTYDSTTSVGNSADITGTGFETVAIDVSKAAETIGTITVTPTGSATSKITISGTKSVTMGAGDKLEAKVVDASGLNVSEATQGLKMITAATTNTSQSITGSGGIDTLIGGGGNDVISGGAGNDAITAGGGNDSIAGGTGNDTITFASAGNLTQNDTVDGGDGTDIISVVTSDINTINTAAASLSHVSNVEVFRVSDALQHNIDNSKYGSTNYYQLTGVNGTPTISKLTTGATIEYLASATTGGSTDVVTATLASDGSADTLNVKLTNSEAVPSASEDSGDLSAANFETIAVTSGRGSTNTTTTTNVLDLTGTSGLKTLTVAGNVLFQSTVSSTAVTSVDASASTGGVNLNVSAATGNATIVGSAVADTITAGAGNDTITLSGGADSVAGGSGADTIDGGDGDDTIDGGAGSDSLTGGANADTFYTSAGTDTFDGGDGTDILYINNAAYTNISGQSLTSIESLNMNSMAVTLSASQFAGFTTFTSATGGVTFSDAGTIASNTQVAKYTLANGTNTFTASSASAVDYNVTGGTGADTFNFGSDMLTSADTIVGGTGADTLNITGNTIIAASDLDKVSGIERIFFNNTSTAVAITLADTVFEAATGTGTIDASSLTTGALTLAATAEDDQALIVVGGAGGNTVAAGTGADTITGGVGIDSITGGDGADVIDLVSDSAADKVVLGGNTAGDTISNLDLNAEDIIQIDVNGSGETGAFTTTAGQATTLLVTGTNAASSSDAAAGATISFQTITATGNFNATAGNEVLVFDNAAFNSAANIQAALQAGTVMTFSDGADTGCFLAVYDAGTTVNIALVKVSGAATTAAATVTDIATLVGVSDLTQVSTGDFVFI